MKRRLSGEAELAKDASIPACEHPNVHHKQLAVDHVFTGTYFIRFRPKDPEENSACPCGGLFRTDLHVV